MLILHTIVQNNFNFTLITTLTNQDIKEDLKNQSESCTYVLSYESRSEIFAPREEYYKNSFHCNIRNK